MASFLLSFPNVVSKQSAETNSHAFQNVHLSIQGEIVPEAFWQRWAAARGKWYKLTQSALNNIKPIKDLWNDLGRAELH